MFFHVMLGATDLEAARRFYDATFSVLGTPAKGKFREQPEAYMYGDLATGVFFVTKAVDGKPATYANGGTVMFKAKNAAEVEEWHRVGLANGGIDEDAPGPAGMPGSTVARMRDPTGNKIGAIAFS